jgi:hypothetical protein
LAFALATQAVWLQISTETSSGLPSNFAQQFSCCLLHGPTTHGFQQPRRQQQHALTSGLFIVQLSVCVPQVLQYRQAVQAIIQGNSSTATPLLLQLLQEPLLQAPSPDASTAAARPAAARPGAAGRKQQQQPVQQPVQSEILQGLRPRVLLSLAPLLGQSQAGLQIWAEVLAYEPLNPKVWEEISIVLASLGHLPLAVHAAERACSLRPTDVTLQEQLVLILAALEVGLLLLVLPAASDACC